MNIAEKIPISPCIKCGRIDAVENKMLSITSNPEACYFVRYEILDPEVFKKSPYTCGDFFVNALFCKTCQIGFIPDPISIELGLGENMI